MSESKEKAKVVQVNPSRCPKCGGTRRNRYFAVTVHEHGGMDKDGNLYTHVVNRRTSCKDCGQVRIDRSYENRFPDAVDLT